MVYVADDGSVVNSVPWSVRRVFGIFTGMIYMVVMFFQTLVSPGMDRTDRQSTRDFRPGSGPRPPSRRLGRPNTGDSVDIPFFGGCSSCAR
ncbi:PREDICTED: selenoprotein K-like [Dinoponera quadriceps]|uniref:Selenoprotein K-like n=1 Tax=Dinoponera quadriceps TaxID=609295 RepID=A0A6P3WX68_DINQU|nr:PREDICTED: selenoprotein K-like [Dinoponera quadriceps]